MAQIKKISSSLSVAAAVLLEACGSSGGETGPVAVANTTAPQLVANWATDCVITQNSGSTTTTGASGGGGGSIAGGEAYISSVVFHQDGHVEFNTQYFATANCNANTLAGVGQFNGVYTVGAAGQAADGSPVTEVNISDGGRTTYTIFQVLNSTSLYLGDTAASTPGNDGGSEATRLDGLGPRMLKL